MAVRGTDKSVAFLMGKRPAIIDRRYRDIELPPGRELLRIVEARLQRAAICSQEPSFDLPHL